MCLKIKFISYPDNLVINCRTNNPANILELAEVDLITLLQFLLGEKY